ncbi:MAG TPA: tetratricopeptide repeat protein, partial [Bacteroidia bacterium]|nr:tetratricopeptide repeat protein [Bacteroidia bacterium]
MRYSLLLIFSISVFVQVQANQNTVKVDSLLKVWNNKQLADTTRIKAIKQLSWECYAFTNTDTAAMYASLGYEFAKQKNNQKYMSMMLNTLGSVYALKGEFKESIKLFHQALAIQQRMNDNYGVAKTYNNIGYIYRNQNNFTEALEYQLKSIEMQDKYNLKDFKLATLVNIGITYQELNDYNLAIKYYLKGLKIAEEAKDAVQITDIQNNIGLIYIDQKDYAKALKLYQKNFEIYEKANNKLGLAMSYLNIGVCCVHLNSKDSALSNYAKALNYFEQLDDKPHITKTLNNIGIIHQKSHDFNAALNYFQKSLFLSKSMGSKKDIAASLGNMGYIFKQQNKLAEAKKYYEESFELAQQSGSIDEISNSASFLWDYYKATHQFEKALKMHEIYVQTKDSISNDTKQKEMLKASMKFMYEKKATADSVNTAKQIEIKNVELNKQRIQIKAKRNEQIALILGLALVIIFSGFLYNRFRVIQHQKVIIENAHQSLAIKSKEILDSINYSKRIQTAILPPERIVKEYLQDSFILYLPKDIVAGDFYWMEKIGHKVYVAACDCTGHGVPGALVSVVCNNALNRAVNEFGERLPGKIFDKTRALVLESFAKS